MINKTAVLAETKKAVGLTVSSIAKRQNPVKRSVDKPYFSHKERPFRSYTIYIILSSEYLQYPEHHRLDSFYLLRTNPSNEAVLDSNQPAGIRANVTDVTSERGSGERNIC